jgi:hypothetical protein
MDFEFNIKLNQEELDTLLSALEKMPFGEVMHLVKKIAHQISEQTDDAAEFELDMEDAARNWKPSPQKKMSLGEALAELQKQLKPQNDVMAEKPSKPHWTQTPEGKKKMAARKRRGGKK